MREERVKKDKKYEYSEVDFKEGEMQKIKEMNLRVQDSKLRNWGVVLRNGILRNDIVWKMYWIEE